MEVDAPGCSYNPDRGQHQDAVAAAVAAEVRKGLDRELEARPPPRTVDWAPEADPLALLQARCPGLGRGLVEGWTLGVGNVVPLQGAPGGYGPQDRGGVWGGVGA